MVKTLAQKKGSVFQKGSVKEILFSLSVAVCRTTTQIVLLWGDLNFNWKTNQNKTKQSKLLALLTENFMFSMKIVFRQAHFPDV